jgi:hypothetical protein
MSEQEMDDAEKEVFIRQKAIENRHDLEGLKIYWSRHAITEAVQDSLTRLDVEAALESGEVIEDYPAGHRPLPDCLVLGFLTDGRPLHAVVAIDIVTDRIFIVTVYLPAEERWHNDWRTRK